MKREQFYVYGHELTEKEIRLKHKYTLTKITKSIYDNERYTITFDVRAAYAYMLRGYKVIIWGGLYKGVIAFVFDRKRVDVRTLPF